MFNPFNRGQKTPQVQEIDWDKPVRFKSYALRSCSDIFVSPYIYCGRRLVGIRLRGEWYGMYSYSEHGEAYMEMDHRFPREPDDPSLPSRWLDIENVPDPSESQEKTISETLEKMIEVLCRDRPNALQDLKENYPELFVDLA